MTTTEQAPTDLATEDQPTLYERLGGYDAISKFTSEILIRCMRDPVIGHFWNTMSEDRVFEEHINFVDWASAHWGGEARYRGRNMTVVHRGMGVTDEHWDALFRIIDDCYDYFGVSPELREEVDTFLRKFKPAVVNGPSFREVVVNNPDMYLLDGMKKTGVKFGPTVNSAPPNSH